MLTITETIDAINAIDTDPDVLRNAMHKLLAIKVPMDSRAIAIDIIEKYAKNLEAHEFISVLCLALGSVAASACRADKLQTMIDTVNSMVTKVFMQSRKTAFFAQLNTDPDKALDTLEQMFSELGIKL